MKVDGKEASWNQQAYTKEVSSHIVCCTYAGISERKKAFCLLVEEKVKQLVFETGKSLTTDYIFRYRIPGFWSFFLLSRENQIH